MLSNKTWCQKKEIPSVERLRERAAKNASGGVSVIRDGKGE